MNKRLGFTLAEVLITLAIIGTVAAMTIPTLMINTNKMEFKTGFKKILSTTNQAVTMSVALNYVDFSDAVDTTTISPTQSILGIFLNRMHVTRTVDGNADTAVSRMFKNAGSNYTVFFADGMVLSYPKDSKRCTVNGRAVCKGIVDVNGTRAPNFLSNCEGSNVKNAVSDSTNHDCTPENLSLGDQFSIFMADQQVQPNGQAAKFILFEN